MKKIMLSGSDKVAMVDNEDFDKVSKYRWRITSHGYARAFINGKNVYMHRLLLGSPKGKEIDHINHDRLDNRKINIRPVTTSQNQLNRPKTVGVCYVKNRSKYMAYIMVNRKQRSLGHYRTYAEALNARKSYELKEGLLLVAT